MDLKSKRISGITEMVIAISMLLLYTKIGSVGTVYIAISLELVFGVVLLFLGSTTTNKLYSFLATIVIEALLLLAYFFVIIPSEIMFVGTMIKFLMILVPLYAVLQCQKGVFQSVLEPQISALTDLLFWSGTAIGTFLSCLILGGFGRRAALLMQSAKIEYFYAIISLIPGFVLGFIFAFVFLFLMGRMHQKEIMTCLRQNALQNKRRLLACLDTWKDQITNNYILLIKRIPVWLLLVLSIKEFENGNYLFGHLYGAVLPLFYLLWNLFSIKLITLQTHMYTYHRKRMYEQYYNDLLTTLSFVLIYGIYFLIGTLALHKAYLAIWSLQTESSFMALTKAGCVIAFLGFIQKVLIDIMNERGRARECKFALVSGTIFAAIIAAICHKFLGAGSALYVLSISFGMLVTVLLLGWFIWNDVGLSYLTVLKQSYKGIVLNVFLCVILFILESLIFTAFGGLGTLVICLLFSYLFIRVGLWILAIFGKEERQLLSWKNNLKAILGISR